MFDIPNNQLMLRQAINWGVTYWDTANSYGGGRSEKGIGKFFRRFPETRKQVFLVTKSGSWTVSGMTDHLERSLRRMNTDYIDLFFVHSVRNPRDLDQETRKWAEKAKSSGKIRLFGFSTHGNMAECLLGASKHPWIDGIMMTYNYRLKHDTYMDRAIEACHRAGIGLTAMKTQGGGQVRMDSPAELEMAGKFLQKGYTDGQAKLKAVWEDTRIAAICSQMPNMTLLMSNVAAAVDKKKLSMGEKELLQQQAMETAGGYCAGCTSRCEPVLTNRVPIGDVMRCLMYRRTYGDEALARAVFSEIPPEAKTLMTTADFSAAEAACPRRMPIHQLMREAVQELS
jgi:hypothetical protein